MVERVKCVNNGSLLNILPVTKNVNTDWIADVRNVRSFIEIKIEKREFKL